MTFVVAAGYGITICIATAALMRLFSGARLPVVERSWQPRSHVALHDIFAKAPSAGDENRLPRVRLDRLF